jgi:hypothetical protein
VKILALITATFMLLATYVLTVLWRRVGAVLEAWDRDPVDRWSPVMPSSSK